MEPALYQVKDRFIPITVSALFVLFVVMLPRFTDTAKAWFALLILLSLGYLATNLGQFKVTSRPMRWYFAVLIANFLWIALSYYANGEPVRGDSFLWGRHFYSLFVIPLYFLFRKVDIDDRVILVALFTSILLSLSDILIDLAQNINHRIQGMNPNAFGPIQLCLSGVLIFYFLEERREWLRWTGLAGASMGIVTIILSLSKSTWLTLTVLGVAFVFYLTRRLPLWKRAVMVVTLLLLVGASYLIPFVEQRIDIGLKSVQNYYASEEFRDDNQLGTFGIRMELWKTGWNIFLENPVIGVGVGAFKDTATANSERYQVNPVVHKFKYVHNQYLATLATRGAPGLMLFLMVMVLPLYFAIRSDTTSSRMRIARLSTSLIIMVYLIGCLAEDHFEGKSAIMFTVVMLPMLLARLTTRSIASPMDTTR